MCSELLAFKLGKTVRSVASEEQRKAEQVISVGHKPKTCAHSLPAKRGVQYAGSCSVLLLNLGVEVDFATSHKRLAFSYQAAWRV